MNSHMFIIPLIAMSVSGVANTVSAMNGHDSLPNLNIEAGCKDVAKNGLNKTTDFPGCLRDERKARDSLRKEWASYSAEMHTQCLHLVTPPALPSYVTLQQCLVMARDAQKLIKSDGATEIGKTLQVPTGE